MNDTTNAYQFLRLLLCYCAITVKSVCQPVPEPRHHAAGRRFTLSRCRVSRARATPWSMPRVFAGHSRSRGRSVLGAHKNRTGLVSATRPLRAGGRRWPAAATLVQDSNSLLTINDPVSTAWALCGAAVLLMARVWRGAGLTEVST